METAAALPDSALVRADRADLGLEFADTRFWRGTEQPTETLNAPSDLLGWCGSMGALDPAALGALEARWRAQAAEGVETFTQALGLRETLYRVFSATASGGAPRGDDLDLFNRMLGRAPPRTRLPPEMPFHRPRAMPTQSCGSCPPAALSRRARR